MDLKLIEKLMSLMDKSQIKRVVIKEKEFEIELEKEGINFVTAPPHMMPQMPSLAPSSTESKVEKKEGEMIVSPMVGTFYSTPSPDDPPFVKVGDIVEKSTVVCIVEAMKVLNEVKAGKQGKILEILKKNGEPVEFGTKLFRIG